MNEFNRLESFSKSLLAACEKNEDLDLAILLINKGSNINHQEEDKNEYGEKMVKTPLTICCENNNIELCKILIDNNVDIHLGYDEKGYSPIAIAITNNYIDIFKLLIEKIDDINVIINKNNSTMLHIASCNKKNNNLEIATILINKGANVNVIDKDGYFPIVYAIRSINVDIFHLLIELVDDSKFNFEQPLITTMLHEAVYKNNLEIVKILLNKGVNVNAKYKNDIGSCYYFIQEAIKNNYIDLFKLLFEKIDDVNMSVDVYNITMLHVAARYNNLNVVNLLINSGANVNSKDKNDDYPMHIAAMEGNVDVVNLLIEKKADIHNKDKDGNTSFHYSCRYGHIKICLLLIKHGADIYSTYTKNNDDTGFNHTGFDRFGSSIYETGLDRYGNGLYPKLSAEVKNKYVNILKDAYKIECNWKRRKEFIMFLTQNKFIKNNYGFNKIDIINNENKTVIEDVFTLKELNMNIISYL